MRRIFERADELVVAMEARAFTEDRTDLELAASKRDWIALIVVGCMSIMHVYHRVVFVKIPLEMNSSRRLRMTVTASL